MKLHHLILASVTLALAHTPEAAPEAKPGAITGKVVFFKDGKPQTPPTDAFVYLLPARGTKLPPLKVVTAKIHQKDQDFFPRRVVIPVGSTVAFPNDDRIPHNVFSPTDPIFNLDKYPGGQSKSRIFAQTGEYDIYCDIHVNMNAKVKVVESDRIAPIVNGMYTLVDVPPGTYRLVAWAPDSEEVTEPTRIVVAGGQNVSLPNELHLHFGDHYLAPGQMKPHTKASGKPYCKGGYCKP